MNKARVLVLGIALTAGAAAMYLSSSPKGPAPQLEALPQPQPKIESDEVLTAAQEISLGAVVGDRELAWTPWPRGAVGNAMITRANTPNAIQDLKGSIARGAFLQGEPIRREKLVKGPNAGFLSAVLPTGMRAVSISIDTQGTTTAGGFILPNDRVDVVRTGRADDSKGGGAESFTTETILSDVRVLAIGQNVQERNGERTVSGANATLEVSPGQAEALILAQRVGGLTLVLRSILDAGRAQQDDQSDTGLTVIRYGVQSNVGRR